jgi:biopolymer transport protein ExbB
MNDIVEKFIEFFESGGPVLIVILITSILLWSLIIERYYYYFVVYPEKLSSIITQWTSRTDHTSWYALRIRDGLLADISITLKQYLIPIQTFTSVLPLLGLLGTVTGMIAIFDVLNVFGNGNTRGMASGISRALLPTTAGLVTSMAGLYFSSDLDRRAKLQAEKAQDLLEF